MGTPEFAVESLKALMDAGHDIAAVVYPVGLGNVSQQHRLKVLAGLLAGHHLTITLLQSRQSYLQADIPDEQHS